MTRLSKLINYLILALLFFLPWQARWIYGAATMNGRLWEYGTLSFYGTEILLWLIVILTGIRLFSKRDFWQKAFSSDRFKKRWPYLIVGVLVAIVGGYSVALSPLQDVSIQFLSRLIGILCLALCLGLSSLPFERMAVFFWSGGLLQGFIALWQFFSQQVVANKWLGIASQIASGTGVSVVQTESERWLRAYGSFGSPNSLGIYLALTLLVGLIAYSEYGNYLKSWSRLIFLGGQMIIFAALIFSFSRTAWLAAIIGIITYFIIAYTVKVKKENVRVALKQIMAFVLIVAAIVILYFPLFSTRLGACTYLENLSLSERLSQSQIAKEIIFSQPLSGVGPGLYTYYLASNYEAPVYGTYQPVHNIYLLSLAELGLPVFILLGIFIIWLIMLIYRKHSLYLSLIIALLSAGLFDHFLWSLYAGQVIFWVIFGLGLAKNEPESNESAKTS